MRAIHVLLLSVFACPIVTSETLTGGGKQKRLSEVTALQLSHTAIKERKKRQTDEGGGTEVEPPQGPELPDGDGGTDWTDKIKQVLDTAGQFTNFLGTLGPTAQKALNVISGFHELSAKRAELRMKERQFNMELEQKTIQLCSTICVSAWSPWTPCSAPCGGGTRSRKRERFGGGVCNGKPCPHHLNESEVCNSACANNGYPSGTGQCSCPRGYDGHCCNNEIMCLYPGSPTHGRAEPRQAIKFGGLISYTCSDGHALVGADTMVCGQGGRWVGTPPTCQKITCSEPPTPANGKNLNRQTTYQFGETAFFTCNYGYELTGNQKRTCTNVNGATDGVWDGFLPLCLPAKCGNPGFPLNGNMVGTEFTLGNVVTYSCMQGFRLVGSSSRQCLATGTWSGNPATCELITCEEPFIPRNGRLRRSRESYYIGISITFECEEGYALEGSPTAICEKDPGLSHLGTGGKWSVESPVCKPTQCGDPGDIQNGAKDGSIFYHPNNVTFVCFNGYILQGAAQIHCAYDGTWSASPPTCIPCEENQYNTEVDGMRQCMTCPPNSHTATDASTSVLQCVCDIGYTGPPGGPCTEIVCPTLQIPENGGMSCQGNKYRNSCDFTCRAGHILDKGSSRRSCQDYGAWTGNDAQCSACPVNTYKSDERSCLPCPTHSHTVGTASVKSQCVCDDGYEGPAGGPCSDTNECSANGGKGPCEDVCRNTDGSYVCECSIPGYIIDLEVDKHACKRDKTCRNLTETDAPKFGGLVCHWYNEENSQQCAVRCNAGYEFPSRVNNYEYCGAATGYVWSHEERGDIFEACVEEFFPGVQLEASSSYFVRNCQDLTVAEKEKVKEDFATLLTNEGICMRRNTQVCDPQNVGIICGATKRRKRGTATVDQVDISFKLAARLLQPSDCDEICTMLRIPKDRCAELCIKTYRRFLLALMTYTKRSLETLFTDARKVSFRSGVHPFVYERSSLNTSDVIVDCPTGMKKEDAICVPCSPGSRFIPNDNACVQCPLHTFQANPQQTMCRPCPAGTFAPNTGSTGCMSCPYNKWGDKCAHTCDCENGQCDATNGQCVCYSGWEGPSCNIDTQSCTADSCFPGVRCHDIPAPGTGFRCEACPDGFVGDGTICQPVSRKRRDISEEGIYSTNKIMQLSSMKALNLGLSNFP